jgi:hypothetical protein
MDAVFTLIGASEEVFYVREPNELAVEPEV